MFPIGGKKYDLANTLHVIDLMRENGKDLLSALTQLSLDPQSRTRRCFAARWRKRIIMIRQEKQTLIPDYQI